MRIPAIIKKPFVLRYNRGNKYKCPFCGYSSKSLQTIGIDLPVFIEKEVVGAGRREGGCYKCGSLDRDRLMYALLKYKWKVFEGGKDVSILHIAPEKWLTRKMLKHGFSNYVCGDLFTEGYHYESHVRNMNVLNLPFDDNSFDIVICNHVLEHVPDDITAMDQLFRVLKPGGKAVLQVPISLNQQTTHEDLSVTDPLERERLFGQFDHVRMYGQDYEQRLTRAGFKVQQLDIANEFPQLGLNPKEVVFVGLK